MTEFFIIAILTGLAVGSFLNVLIYRLPKMIEQEEHDFCTTLLGQTTPPQKKPFNLCAPRSHCPHCKHPIFWYYNLPLISFLYLKGRCKHCHKAIESRYFFVELITGLATGLLAWYFDPTPVGLGLIFLAWCHIALCVIDIKWFILPDEITLLLVWTGLLLNAFNTFTSPEQAIIGAALGYLLLFIPNQLFVWIKAQQGIGHGDFKLFAATGAWFGWQLLPEILWVSALSALLIMPILWFKQKSFKALLSTKLPFGPFLCLGTWYAIIKMSL